MVVWDSAVAPAANSTSLVVRFVSGSSPLPPAASGVGQGWSATVLALPAAAATGLPLAVTRACPGPVRLAGNGTFSFGTTRGPYGPMLDCTWVLSAPSTGGRLSLSLTVGLEAAVSGTCPDWVDVRVGAGPRQLLCGSGTHTFVSAGSQISVQLVSNANVSASGGVVGTFTSFTPCTTMVPLGSSVSVPLTVAPGECRVG
jgi:hypothetical protein